MNVGGGQSIFAQSSSRVTDLDAELRDKHTGKPAEDIKPLALLALRRIGVSLSDAELVADADGVSRGEAFTFHLSCPRAAGTHPCRRRTCSTRPGWGSMGRRRC